MADNNPLTHIPDQNRKLTYPVLVERSFLCRQTPVEIQNMGERAIFKEPFQTIVSWLKVIAVPSACQITSLKVLLHCNIMSMVVLNGWVSAVVQ